MENLDTAACLCNAILHGRMEAEADCSLEAYRPASPVNTARAGRDAASDRWKAKSNT